MKMPKENVMSNHETSVKTSIKLEVGKTYKDVNGNVFEVKEKRGTDMSFFCTGHVRDVWFNEDGTSFDGIPPLIEEVGVFDPRKPAATFDGRLAKIVAHRPELAPNETIVAVVDGKFLFFFENGRYNKDSVCSTDLVNIDEVPVSIRGVTYLVTLEPKLSIRKM
jgi:hypothetical protein